MLIGVWLLKSKSGCCGSVMSQYPMPSQLTMGMVAFAHVHRYVVLVSSCLNNPYH